ncbi:hypothetical protein [Thorsellia kenyensis]|uniref:Lipoprotein n=1 Tax=Thorsellia kenyensis TaxID=1549888 RepID=A0ABV6C6P7_9GAMM
MSSLSYLHRLKSEQAFSVIFKTVAVAMTLALVGCSMPPKTSDENFCIKVDPSSPDYNPNALTTAELKICRDRAEKILQVQTMQVQIHRQRDEVIALTSNNDLVIENKAIIENALAKLPDSKKSTSTSQTNNATQRNVIVRKPSSNNSPAGRPDSVQQHFLSQSAQREFDRRQAEGIASKVGTLINSEEKQALLNAPRSLQPGEEIRDNRNLTSSVSNNIDAPNSAKEEISNSTQDRNIQSLSKSSEVLDSKTDYQTITTSNSVTKAVVNPGDTKNSNKVADNPTNPKNNGLSTDYTSLPNFASELDKSELKQSETNKPLSQNEDAMLPKPIIDGKTRPDPLIRMQQIRNQN